MGVVKLPRYMKFSRDYISPAQIHYPKNPFVFIGRSIFGRSRIESRIQIKATTIKPLFTTPSAFRGLCYGFSILFWIVVLFVATSHPSCTTPARCHHPRGDDLTMSHLGQFLASGHHFFLIPQHSTRIPALSTVPYVDRQILEPRGCPFYPNQRPHEGGPILPRPAATTHPPSSTRLHATQLARCYPRRGHPHTNDNTNQGSTSHYHDDHHSSTQLLISPSRAQDTDTNETITHSDTHTLRVQKCFIIPLFLEPVELTKPRPLPLTPPANIRSTATAPPTSLQIHIPVFELQNGNFVRMEELDVLSPPPVFFLP